MNRYLEPGYSFSVPEMTGGFHIAGMIGRGASCAVYRADFTDGHGNRTEHILKEYNPKRIDMYRENNGELCVESEDDAEEFEAGLRRFAAGYERQNAIRRISGLKNATSNIQGIYHANGTRYIDMTCFEGSTYDTVRERSLYELLRRMKAVTQVLGSYHKAGFLHLDVKPENIYTVPETCELVMLFDFDSVTEKEHVPSNAELSYTKSWAAPEQTNPAGRGSICEATDLFAVGEMIFFQLTGRHSSPEERRSGAEYVFDRTAAVFENVNPRVFPMLDELLRRTICALAKERYQSAEKLTGALDGIIRTADPKEPYIMKKLPGVQDFFVGRDAELEAIHSRLCRDNVLFLSGIGGIGKSELAKQYARRYQEEYDSVCFAPYHGSEDSLIMDDSAISVCNFQPYPDEKPEDYCARKLRRLQELCDDRTLIIIDNYDADGENGIGKLLELGCRLLITTRNDLSGGDRAQLHVGALADRTDVRAIFDRYYTRPLAAEEESCVGRIIELVAGHTMTVELLARQMTAGRVRPEDMLRKLQRGGMSESGGERVRVTKDAVQENKSAYDHVRALFDLSGLAEDEKYVMSCLALIPYTGVSAELFHNWCELDGYDVINELVYEGWMRRDERSDLISMHPVVSDIVLDQEHDRLGGDLPLLRNIRQLDDINKYTPEEKTANAELLAGVARKLIAQNIGSENAADFLCDALYPYRDCGYLNEAERSSMRAAEIRLSMSGEKSESVASVYNTLGNLASNKGDLGKAEEYHLKALKINLKLHGENNDGTALSYNGLGCMYLYRGDLTRAEKYILKSLAIYLKLHGEKNGETAAGYSNLASINLRKENYDKAEEYSRKALDIALELYGEKSDIVSTSYNILGSLYHEKGDMKKAEEHYRKALEISREQYGEKNGEVAVAYNNIGRAYEETGDLDAAEKYLKKALEIKLELYGEEYSNSAVIYRNLGDLSDRRCDPDKAEEYFLKALEIRRKLYGEEHGDVAASYCDLGALYQSRGDIDKSLEYFQKALDIRLKLYGEKHGDVAESYFGVGYLYHKKDDFEKAEEYYLTALAIRRKLYGEKHGDVAETYNILGMLYAEKGSLKKAEEYFRKALEIMRKLYGEEDSRTAETYYDLERLYEDKKEPDKALEYARKALEIRSKLNGEKHSDVAALYNNIGHLYHEKGNLAAAEEYYQKALGIKLELYGEGDSETAGTLYMAYYNLGRLYEDKKEPDKAEECHQKDIALHLKHNVGENSYAASSYSFLGYRYSEKGDYEKAEEYCRKVLEIGRNLYGEESSSVANLYNNLGIINQNAGNTDKALECCHKALEIRRKLYGEKSQDVADSYGDVGYLYMKNDDMEQAQKYMLRSYEIYRNMFGENDQQTREIAGKIKEWFGTDVEP